MIPAISQVCSLDAPFEKDVADYAAGKCTAIELWVGKLDAYLERVSARPANARATEKDGTPPAEAVAAQAA